MNNESLANGLQGKVEKLIDVCVDLKKLTVRLNNEKNELQEQLYIKEEEISSLKTENLAGNISTNVATDDVGSSELKLKINDYIREIDRCIGMMNS